MLMYIIGIIVITILAGYWLWIDRFEKRPLASFGIENVQRVMRFETHDCREAIWKRGWMTSREWIKLLEKQSAAIDAELRKRDIDQ